MADENTNSDGGTGDSTDTDTDRDDNNDGKSGPTPNGAWNRTDMESFLNASTVPIRLACRTPSGGLWMLSLWYRYHDGMFWCATERTADVVGFLQADPAVAFEVSVNEPPYKGVRGQGTATIESDPEKATLRRLLNRYLGGTNSQLAQRLLADDRDEVTIQIDPETLYCWDFTDRMEDAVE